MCTVTFIPSGNKAFITHNRDEKSIRSRAIAPEEYLINGQKLLFPKDSQAGGTWIALHVNGSAAVLLNGGFVKHTYQPPYRKSRGLAFLDIVASTDLYSSWHKTDLDNIEPFTVVLWNQGDLYECRWDGQQKHTLALDATKTYTWSSVTLYGEETIARRKTWFENWLLQHPDPSQEDIIQFHLSGGDGDVQNNLRMNRDGVMLTVSITAMEITPGKCLMKYVDLQDNTTSLQEMSFTKVPATKA